MYEVGSYRCPPCYSYGPVVREHYVLHFIREGKGFLRLGGKAFPVHQNQAFITPPDELLYYEADEKEPWSYIWIIINGKKVPDLFHQAGITIENPIYTPAYPCPEIGNCMQSLLVNMGNEYQCIGTLYQLFHFLIASSSDRHLPETDGDASLPYIRKAIQFITEKYPEPIKIQHIANSVGYPDPFAFSKIFKQKTCLSPTEYRKLHFPS